MAGPQAVVWESCRVVGNNRAEELKPFGVQWTESSERFEDAIDLFERGLHVINFFPFAVELVECRIGVTCLETWA